MSTFVHNEPTSLAIIQEAGLPEFFYKAIEYGIEPAIEVGATRINSAIYNTILCCRSFKLYQMQSEHCA